MPVGKNKGGKHDITDPRKKLASTANIDRSQQLSDKRASMVSKGKLTRAQAEEADRADDAKVSKIVSVSSKVRGSSQNLPSKSKTTKANFKLDNRGRKIAY